MGPHAVHGHTLAVGVHNAKVVLSAGLALLGGTAEPPHGRRIVLGYAVSPFVHEAEVVLGFGQSRGGRT